MGLFKDFFYYLKTKTVYIGGVGTYTGHRPIDIERQELCSAIIDCNATHIAKGQVMHVVKDKDGRIKQIKRQSEYSKLFRSPNPMMTRQDFMYSMAWQLQLTNLALAWIKWDANHPVEIWPLVYLSMEVRKRLDGGYAVQFYDTDSVLHTIALEDLVVIRRKYNGVGYTGQGNDAVKNSVEMVESLDEGLKQAVQISNKIHGILKQKKAMLAPENTSKNQDEFADRMSKAAEKGGVVALDATEEYQPINVTAWTANAVQQKQITDRVYTYWRTPVEVVSNTATEQVMQNYLDSIVEPVWEEMSEAFTDALFTRREQAAGSCILVSSAAATGASWNTKLMIVSNTKDLGLLTPNEYRELLGYPPVEDGDERLVSLNYVKSTDQSTYQLGEETQEPQEKQQEEPQEEQQEEQELQEGDQDGREDDAEN